jgi:predicted RNA-binding Zn-ribbon protein involved in translation (DUF1610 family)
MAAKRPEAVKPEGRTFDEAYGFSFSIALGLVLFIGGLVLSLTLSQENSYGLFFGVPLIIAGLVIPLFMMRGSFTRSEIIAPCPNCGSEIKTTDSTMQLDCPTCGQTISVRDGGLYRRDEGIE